MVDLGKVVVFRGQPEDGGVGPARGRGLPGASQSGSRLEGREERPAKQAHLLPGHHRSGSVAQSLQGCCGCRRRRSVLLGQQANQIRPVRGPLRRSVRTLPPTFVQRPGAEKPTRRRSLGAIVQEQPVQSWHNGDGMALCGQQLVLMAIWNLGANPICERKNSNTALVRMPRRTELMHEYLSVVTLWPVECVYSLSDCAYCPIAQQRAQKCAWRRD